MEILILLTTAFTVSLDSFFCGLSMSIKTKDNFKFILGISLSVFTLCILGRFIGIKTSNALLNYSEMVGGTILIIIALFGFIENLNKSEKSTPCKNLFLESIIIGFAIGLDGSAGCVSLALSGYKSIFVPILITIVHVILLNVAILISNTNIAKKLNKYKFTPQIILFLLGCFKILF